MNRVIRYLTGAALALAVIVAVMPTAQTQSFLTSTTLSAAATLAANRVQLTSTTGVVNGSFLYIDMELLQVQGTPTSTGVVTVRRGAGGSAGAHSSGAKVWVGTGATLGMKNDVSGACSTTAEIALPHINVDTGHIFDCEESIWFQRQSDPNRPQSYAIRDSFDQGYTIMQDDGTAQSLADTEENFVYGSPLGAIEYREEQTKTASTWKAINGVLDISGDNTTSAEGVEVIWGASADATNQWLEAGTQGGCISASITIDDVSGTNQVLIGFRNNAAYVDAAAYDTYTVWSSLGVTTTAGVVTSKEEVSGSTLTDTVGITWADGETRALKVCVSKAGVPSAFYTAAYTTSQTAPDYPNYIPQTMTNSGVAYTAGTGMIPYLSFLVNGTDGPDVKVNWVQLQRLP